MSNISDADPTSGSQSSIAPPDAEVGTAASPPAADPAIDSAGVAAPQAPDDVAPERSVVPVETMVQSVIDRLGDLETQFTQKIKYDATKEALIERLDAEVQQYRKGLQLSLLRPMLMDLIALHDDLQQCADKVGEDPSTQRTLRSFVASVEEILVRSGASLYETADSTFDGKRHRAARTVDTTVATDAGLIGARIRKGLEYDGRVLRPEIVATYRYVVPEPVADASTTSPNTERDKDP